MKDLHPTLILVVKGGWFTTVQDLGRYGYQQYGVPVAGAMDCFSATVANRLVGNPDDAAVLELTLEGPELQFQRDTVVAITGADLSPTIDSSSISLWESIEVPWQPIELRQSPRWFSRVPVDRRRHRRPTGSRQPLDTLLE